MANECCYPSTSSRLYIGGFGGGLYSNKTRIIQRGTAFFEEDVGGPLAVEGRGKSRRNSTGYGGIQIGYEWSLSSRYMGCSGWSIIPAAEVEAYWYSHTKKGHLMNPSARLPEHDFADSFPMDVGVYLLNGVFALNNRCFGKFIPYLGGGIGVAHIDIRRAKSLQVEPPEVGINHFNAGRSDSSWAFAAQVKTGLRFNVYDRFHIFGEYRLLYLDSSRYVFGSTQYPTHVPTSPWNVDIKNTWYNAFAVGLQFDL